MEAPTVVVAPATRVRDYNATAWNAKRSLIIRLYLYESKTVSDIVTILAQEHNFYVNNGMVTYRLGRWGHRKNCTKAAVEEYFQSGARQSTLCIRDSKDKARLMNGARRHGIQASSAAALEAIDRYIPAPDADRQTESMLTLVSHYVGGVFDGNKWSAERAPTEIVLGYLNWAYGVTPSSFKLLNYLTLAKLCHKWGQGGWAGILLRPAFSELDVCLRDEPYQTIPIILGIFGPVGGLPPGAGPLLLRHCLALSQTFAKAHPIRRIFEQVWRMGPGKKEDKGFRDFMFRQAAVRFIKELAAQLGAGGHFACSLLRLLSEGTAGSPSENTYGRLWVAPAVCRLEDPQYFDVSLNVERCIVHAVEFRGHAELLQVKVALEQQRDATPSDETRGMLSRHLQALDVPIHRMGYRDCLMGGDRDGFVTHWRRLTNDRRNPAEHALDSEHLKDLLTAWRLFTQWGRVEQAQNVQRRVEEMLVIIHQMMR